MIGSSEENQTTIGRLQLPQEMFTILPKQFCSPSNEFGDNVAAIEAMSMKHQKPRGTFDFLNGDKFDGLKCIEMKLIQSVLWVLEALNTE